jgi:hypothetical protein
MSVVMMPRGDRESWTDERLDDLNHKVDEGFRDMREEFRAMRSETRSETQGLRAEIASSRRMGLQIAAAIWVTSLVGFLGVIATILTAG